MEMLDPTELVEFNEILREATRTVEDELAIEDRGWLTHGAQNQEIIVSAQRIIYLKQSRLYYLKDPLAHQAIRLWTDYTFGRGMTWQAEDEGVKKALEAFWNSKLNKSVLSARGQRLSSDKLLVDGEVFFAVFLGADGAATIRRIDPLEITEIISDPDDIEDVYFYKREWSDGQARAQRAVYRSYTNKENKPMADMYGQTLQQTEGHEALVYHLTYNTISQRGYPLLLPGLDWLKEYRRFLASRVAIMLALAKFAWKGKVKGGQSAVDAVKTVLEGQAPAAASTIFENENMDTTPIKTDSGARNAYQDGRMLKLQFCAAVGIPEQYFGDISIGNLATAKTVELPMMKQFASLQMVWGDTHKDLDDIVLDHNKVSEDKRHVDRDFPPITPQDVAEAAEAIVKVVGVMPQFAYSRDVQQMALMTLGINNPGEVLDALDKAEESGNIDARLAKTLREFTLSLKSNGRKELTNG